MLYLYRLLNSITSCGIGITILIILIPGSMFSQTPHNLKIEELSFNVPEGNWTIKQEPDKKWEVIMYKEKTSIVKVVGYSIIKVNKDSLKIDFSNISNKEIADSVFHNEYRLLLNEAGQGNYEVLDTSISKKEIAEKEFYCFSFKTILHKKPLFNGDNILYLYFPEDIKERHVYYKFLLNEYVADATLFITNDLETINPVLEKIKIDIKK